VRSAQTAGDAKRKQGEEPESERRSTRRNTNKAGTGPPRCLDNCANNTPPNPIGQEEDCDGVTHKARHKKREKKIVEEDEKKAVDERVDEERGAAR